MTGAGRIHGYMIRLILAPLMVTVLITMILFLLDQMLRLFDFILVKSGPVELVWRMLSQLLPQYLSHGVSLGLFIGILFAFRRLSLNHELDALASAGVSLRRLMGPACALALLAMAVNYVIIAYLQPIGLYHYQELRYLAAVEAVKARIRVGQFLPLGEGATLRVSGVTDGGGTLTGVFIERCGDGGACVVATAARGSMNFADGGAAVRFDLRDGRLVRLGAAAPDTLEFDSYAFTVGIPALRAFRARGADHREATMGELYAALRAGGAADGAERPKYLAHFHWRLLHTLTFLAIPFAAAGFGVADPRRPSFARPVAGIAALVLYNEVLEGGQRWVAAGGASPWFAMWPVFLAFALVSLGRFALLAERPGRGAERAMVRLPAPGRLRLGGRRGLVPQQA